MPTRTVKATMDIALDTAFQKDNFLDFMNDREGMPAVTAGREKGLGR
jgi:hypothetical protein